jgi:hypothetical protein
VAELIGKGDDKHPKLVITIPPSFFESKGVK